MTDKMMSDDAAQGRETRREKPGVARVGGVAAPRGVVRLMVPVVLVLLLVAGGGVAVVAGVLPARRARAELVEKARARAEERPRVVVAPAQEGPATLDITLPARLEARSEAPVFPRESGYLRSVTADIGDTVAEGQVLAVVETPVLDQELRVAEANIGTAQARTAEAAAQLQLSRATLERLEAVPDIRAVSGQALDDARAKVLADEASQRAAAAALQAAESDRQRLTERKALANVTAPFAGEISQRGYDAGALVVADKTDASRPIFRITDRSEIRAFVDLPQTAAVLVRPEQGVEVRVRELPGRVFKGVVTRASSAVDTSTRTRLVEARIDNRERVLLPGMFAEARISVPRSPRPVLIPGEAVLIRDGKPHAAVIASDGRLAYRPITIGRDTGATVEVVEGVSAGERVGISLARQVPEGTVVEPVLRGGTTPGPTAGSGGSGAAPAGTPGARPPGR